MQQKFTALTDWLAGHAELHALLSICLLVLLAWIANWIVNRILVRGLHPQLGTFGLDDGGKLPLKKVIARLANIVPALIAHGGIGIAPNLPASLVAIVQ